ncbi:exosortase-associated protein EpsI, B-type [Pseudoduganella lutea]|uniref:EpsI family protein n=1 Tax=Pseudoduganella lutea TaxID=321985 RepID=A0A4P6KUM2_9BURK|nr:exosortase-associated protein EpsI, B-type [Pseudoduganella lutea]QBE62527.1 EpsI family protein [Pseudoduganella lutea]
MIKRLNAVSLAICVGMLGAAWATHAITPTVRIADTRPQIRLAESIPAKFGEWEEDRSQVAAVINPTTQAELDKIYAETLSRTYVNQRGERIMLSIAYGSNQRDDLAVHFPEGCYGGQGFAVAQTVAGELPTVAGKINVSRTEAKLNSRIEPITYWVVVGERSVPNSWEVKKIKLQYAFKGLIPDATLMRVSNITADRDGGYQLQQQFINEMLAAMPVALRNHFAGVGG